MCAADFSVRPTYWLSHFEIKPSKLRIVQQHFHIVPQIKLLLLGDAIISSKPDPHNGSKARRRREAMAKLKMIRSC